MRRVGRNAPTHNAPTEGLGARVSERWSPGRPVKVELQRFTPSQRGPMTEDRRALFELPQKGGDGDFLRSVATAVLQISMEADVAGLIGAGRHERSTDRLNSSNGYRDRSLDTRPGALRPRIPERRQGACFPPFLEPRRSPEKALAGVIQEAWIGGVSTRRVDELVQARGRSGVSKRQVRSGARISTNGARPASTGRLTANGRISGSTPPI